MALSFTEGSIGGDIERVPLDRARGVLRHGAATAAGARRRGRRVQGADRAPTASPSRRKLTADGHALLLINPHTSFFFRSELQMTSDEGLNAYGAVDLGPVLHLPGLQRPRRLDAHLHRRRHRRRVRRDHRAQGRQAVLPLRRGAAAGDDARRSPCRTAAATARWRSAQLHRLPHPPRPDRARGRRQVDRHRPDEQADRGAGAVVRLRTKASDYAAFREGRRAEGQLVEQHDLRRRQGRDRATCIRSSSRGATTASTTPSRWTAAIRRPTGRACMPLDETPHVLNPPNGWVFNTNNWPYSAAGAGQPEARRLSRATWTPSARIPAASHAIRVLDRPQATSPCRR